MTGHDISAMPFHALQAIPTRAGPGQAGLAMPAYEWSNICPNIRTVHTTYGYLQCQYILYVYILPGQTSRAHEWSHVPILVLCILQIYIYVRCVCVYV